MNHQPVKLGMVGDRKIEGSHLRTRTAILSKGTFRAGTFNVIYEDRIYADFSTRVYGSLHIPALEFTHICGPFKNVYRRDPNGRMCVSVCEALEPTLAHSCRSLSQFL